MANFIEVHELKWLSNNGKYWAEKGNKALLNLDNVKIIEDSVSDFNWTKYNCAKVHYVDGSTILLHESYERILEILANRG